MVSKGLGFGGWTFIAAAFGPSLLFFFFFVSLAVLLSSERLSFGNLPAKEFGLGDWCFMDAARGPDFGFAMAERRVVVVAVGRVY